MYMFCIHLQCIGTRWGDLHPSRVTDRVQWLDLRAGTSRQKMFMYSLLCVTDDWITTIYAVISYEIKFYGGGGGDVDGRGDA
jgi:hypothetical protein